MYRIIGIEKPSNFKIEMSHLMQYSTETSKNSIVILPVHLAPAQPRAHSQTMEPFLSSHLPPLWQGFGVQMSVARK